MENTTLIDTSDVRPAPAGTRLVRWYDYPFGDQPEMLVFTEPVTATFTHDGAEYAVVMRDDTALPHRVDSPMAILWPDDTLDNYMAWLRAVAPKHGYPVVTVCDGANDEHPTDVHGVDEVLAS